MILNMTGGTVLRSIIAVTYPAGSTCSCTDGTKTLTAKDTSGNALFNVGLGEWTVTATNGTETATETVSITHEGQSEKIALRYAFYLIKNGVLQNGFTNKLTSSVEAGMSITQEDGHIKYSRTRGHMGFYLKSPSDGGKINLAGWGHLIIQGEYSNPSAFGRFCLSTDTAWYDGAETNDCIAYRQMSDADTSAINLDIPISSTADAYVKFVAWVAGSNTGTVKLSNVYLKH